MARTPRVLILMATHDAHLTVAKQLDSIFDQAGCEISLWVSDDYSQDNTFHVLETYALDHESMRLHFNTDRKGIERRLVDLLYSCDPDEYDYVGFAYQDEEWRAGKLAASISRISSNTSRPELYYCGVKTIGDDGLSVGEPPTRFTECAASHASLLFVPNWAHASTMLMNRALVKMLKTRMVRDYGRDFWTWIHASALYNDGLVYGDLGRTLVVRRSEDDRLPETPSQRTKLATTLLREYRAQMSIDTIDLLEDVAFRQSSLARRTALSRRGDIAVPEGESSSKLRLDILSGKF